MVSEYPAECHQNNLVLNVKSLVSLSCRGPFLSAYLSRQARINPFAHKCVMCLTQSGQSLQFVLAVGGVRPANLENLVLAVAAGLAQQSPVGP